MGPRRSRRHAPPHGQSPRRATRSGTSESARPTIGMPDRSGAFWKPTGTPCASSHRFPRATGSSANTAPIAPSTSPMDPPPRLGRGSAWGACRAGSGAPEPCASPTTTASTSATARETPTAQRAPRRTWRAQAASRGPRVGRRPDRRPEPHPQEAAQGGRDRVGGEADRDVAGLGGGGPEQGQQREQ